MSARTMSLKVTAAFVLLSAILTLTPVAASAAFADGQPDAPTTVTPADIDWP
jgi:hypothetical protein